MYYTLILCSSVENDVSSFLNSFYETSDFISEWILSNNADSNNKKNNIYTYTKRTTNPLDFVVLLGALIDNDKYNITAWLCLDNGVLINITEKNINYIIKYIYERFPY